MTVSNDFVFSIEKTKVSSAKWPQLVAEANSLLTEEMIKDTGYLLHLRIETIGQQGHNRRGGRVMVSYRPPITQLLRKSNSSDDLTLSLKQNIKIRFDKRVGNVTVTCTNHKVIALNFLMKEVFNTENSRYKNLRRNYKGLQHQIFKAPQPLLHACL